MRALRRWGLMAASLSGAMLTGAAYAMTPEEKAHALIGIEYSVIMPGYLISPQVPCSDEEGGLIQVGSKEETGWAYGVARCGERNVLMLQREIGRVGNHAKWRIVDTVLLPPYRTFFEPDHPSGLMLYDDGQCTWKGHPQTTFVAMVRFGSRTRADWRSGVTQAWRPDLKNKRLISMPTRDIVCHKSDP